MARREFLQLAKPFDPVKHKVGGWLLSEKLDGTRCLWDGGASRDKPTTTIPWANIIDPKTGGPKKKIKPIATGLWSRYGNPIIAPDWFLDKLPPFPLDGELWAGRGNFQLCRSICAGDTPDQRFSQMQFAVFSSPPYPQLFQTGEIKNANMHININYEAVSKWLNENHEPICPPEGSTFEQELFALRSWEGWDDQVYILKQIILPRDNDDAAVALNKHMDDLLEQGAEGVIIRNGQGVWTPKRVSNIFKFKPWNDDEGIVVGFTSGRETDKGSKHLGKIGALILDYKGKRLELSGLTDDERVFEHPTMRDHAADNPGQDMPNDTSGVYFKIGDKVSFKYRELSDDDIPKEARYWRVRNEE